MNRREALKILGLNANPSEREIKTAYRELVVKLHPDKNLDKEQEERKKAEEKCKQLNVAYEFLTGKSAKEAMVTHDEDLDEVSSTNDLLVLLRMAIIDQDLNFLKRILSKFKSDKDEKFGDYINDNSVYVHPALICAVIKGGNIEIIKLLLKHGANYNIQDKYGDTALHYACRRGGYSKIVELLLKCGADPNIKNNDKDTILSDACFYRNSKAVELLLKYGTDPAANSNSALSWAFYCKYNEIIELLLQYRADPNAILVWACQSGDVDLVELLLKYGADPKRKVDGKSPVEFLGHRNRVEIIKLLAQYSGVEKHYLRNRAIEALVFCCFAAGFTALGVMYSPWCFIPAVICTIFTCLAVRGIVKAAFLTETKEPSPEFAEVITEKVVNNVGLNAEDNSKRIDNALA